MVTLAGEGGREGIVKICKIGRRACLSLARWGSDENFFANLRVTLPNSAAIVQIYAVTVFANLQPLPSKNRHEVPGRVAESLQSDRLFPRHIWERDIKWQTPCKATSNHVSIFGREGLLICPHCYPCTQEYCAWFLEDLSSSLASP